MLLLTGKKWQPIFQAFIRQWEGFRSRPYWDYQQWSWGYGTRVPGSSNSKSIVPGGSITREQAAIEAMRYANNDLNFIKRYIKANLSEKQIAALLSFSYNLGADDALVLIKTINTGDPAAIRQQWSKYIYAGGQVNDYLVKRRQAELSLFFG